MKCIEVHAKYLCDQMFWCVSCVLLGAQFPCIQGQLVHCLSLAVFQLRLFTGLHSEPFTYLSLLKKHAPSGNQSVTVKVKVRNAR